MPKPTPASLHSGRGPRVLGSLFCPGGVLMSMNHGAIDEGQGPIKLAVLVGLGLQRREAARSDALRAPAVGA